MITILGNVPSKKNSKRVFMRNGKVRVLPSLAHEQWHDDAMMQLRGRNRPRPLDGYKIMTLVFYPGSKRKGDLTNKAESVLDLLVDAGYIEDDNWYIVPQLVLLFGGVDKENPRVEIS